MFIKINLEIITYNGCNAIKPNQTTPNQTKPNQIESESESNIVIGVRTRLLRKHRPATTP